MKRVLIAFEWHKVAGKVYTDQDSCVYLKPSAHPAFAGREFANELEFNQHVADVQREKPGTLAGAEIILLPVITL